MNFSKQSESALTRKLAMQKHRVFLKDLKIAFKTECARITAESKAKMSEIPEAKKEERQAILRAQKIALDQVLSELKSSIAHANGKLLSTLENLEKTKDEQDLNVLLEEIDFSK